MSKKEIQKIRKLAKTMSLKDVAKVTGYTHTTVEKYAKGIRPRYNSGTLTRPNHPCPACGSIRVVSDGKKLWRCQSCGKKFLKYATRRIVTKRENRQMKQLSSQGMSYNKIASQLNRDKRTVSRHIRGLIIPKFACMPSRFLSPFIFTDSTFLQITSCRNLPTPTLGTSFFSTHLFYISSARVLTISIVNT